MRIYGFVLVLAACGSVEKLDADAAIDADPCTGTCECRVDTDCAGVHTVCDDQVTSRTCACAAGYAGTGTGGACEWNGVIKDPGFQSAAMWTAGTGVMIDPNVNEVGMVEPGAARIGANALCSLAHVTQGLEMPRFSRAEPLVVSATYRTTAGGFDSPAFAVGTTWRDDLPRVSTSWTTARTCLGAAQYAPETSKGKGVLVPIDLMPTLADGACMTESLDIDHIEIKPADPGECPNPGTALNGDAEATGGWRFIAQGANGTLATGMIEASVGEAGTHGARLFATNRCMSAVATDRVSIPDSSVASPALSFYIKASTGSQDFLRFGTTSLPTLGGSNVGTTQRACIPAFMRGNAFDFSGTIDGSGLCADIVNYEAVFDNLKVVNEPACGTDPNVTDPGFEATQLNLIGAAATPGKSIARALNDPNMAHSGSGVLQLGSTVTCFNASWQANVITPASGAGGGPALKFFYRTAPTVQYRFAASSIGTTFTPTQDNQWHQGVSCLNPKLVGRNQAVNFSESFIGGGCQTVITQEQVLIDDLSVGNDSTCPM